MSGDILKSGKIKGYQRLIQDLDAIASCDGEALIALEAGATLIEAHAKDNGPFQNRTGNLRSRITTAVTSTGKHPSVGVGSPMEYAPHVEFGTKYSKAYPFLRPAFDAKADDVVNYVSERLAEYYRRFCK